ncbi:hypothetical protein LguiB_012365 [Lonicera macranthoides]
MDQCSSMPLSYISNLSFMKKMQDFYVELEQKVLLLQHSNGELCREFGTFKEYVETWKKRTDAELANIRKMTEKTEYEIAEIRERTASFLEAEVLNRQILKEKLRTVKHKCRRAKIQLQKELHELDLKLEVQMAKGEEKEEEEEVEEEKTI